MSTVESASKYISLGRMIGAVIFGAVAFGVAAGMSKAKLEGAVQRPAFEKHERAFLDSVSDLRGDIASHEREERAQRQRTDSALLAISRRSEARDCEAQGYPSPWCDHLRPRGSAGPAQAGRPR